MSGGPGAPLQNIVECHSIDQTTLTNYNSRGALDRWNCSCGTWRFRNEPDLKAKLQIEAAIAVAARLHFSGRGPLSGESAPVFANSEAQSLVDTQHGISATLRAHLQNFLRDRTTDWIQHRTLKKIYAPDAKKGGKDEDEQVSWKIPAKKLSTGRCPMQMHGQTRTAKRLKCRLVTFDSKELAPHNYSSAGSSAEFDHTEVTLALRDPAQLKVHLLPGFSLHTANADNSAVVVLATTREVLRQANQQLLRERKQQILVRDGREKALHEGEHQSEINAQDKLEAQDGHPFEGSTANELEEGRKKEMNRTALDRVALAVSAFLPSDDREVDFRMAYEDNAKNTTDGQHLSALPDGGRSTAAESRRGEPSAETGKRISAALQGALANTGYVRSLARSHVLRCVRDVFSPEDFKHFESLENLENVFSQSLLDQDVEQDLLETDGRFRDLYERARRKGTELSMETIDAVMHKRYPVAASSDVEVDAAAAGKDSKEQTSLTSANAAELESGDDSSLDLSQHLLVLEKHQFALALLAGRARLKGESLGVFYHAMQARFSAFGTALYRFYWRYVKPFMMLQNRVLRPLSKNAETEKLLRSTDGWSASNFRAAAEVILQQFEGDLGEIVETPTPPASSTARGLFCSLMRIAFEKFIFHTRFFLEMIAEFPAVFYVHSYLIKNLKGERRSLAEDRAVRGGIAFEPGDRLFLGRLIVRASQLFDELIDEFKFLALTLNLPSRFGRGQAACAMEGAWDSGKDMKSEVSSPASGGSGVAAKAKAAPAAARRNDLRDAMQRQWNEMLTGRDSELEKHKTLEDEDVKMLRTGKDLAGLALMTIEDAEAQEENEAPMFGTFDNWLVILDAKIQRFDSAFEFLVDNLSPRRALTLDAKSHGYATFDNEAEQKEELLEAQQEAFKGQEGGGAVDETNFEIPMPVVRGSFRDNLSRTLRLYSANAVGATVVQEPVFEGRQGLFSNSNELYPFAPGAVTPEQYAMLNEAGFTDRKSGAITQLRPGQALFTKLFIAPRFTGFGAVVVDQWGRSPDLDNDFPLQMPKVMPGATPGRFAKKYAGTSKPYKGREALYYGDLHLPGGGAAIAPNEDEQLLVAEVNWERDEPMPTDKLMQFTTEVKGRPASLRE
eukprot:g3502.t1